MNPTDQHQNREPSVNALQEKSVTTMSGNVTVSAYRMTAPTSPTLPAAVRALLRQMHRAAVQDALEAHRAMQRGERVEMHSRVRDSQFDTCQAIEAALTDAGCTADATLLRLATAPLAAAVLQMECRA